MTLGSIAIVGLGPGDLDQVDQATLRLLTDPASTVLVRTLDHPAARQLAERRTLESGDARYEAATDFDAAYRSIARRVVELARSETVVFAVPGSPLVGERTVPIIRQLAGEAGLEVTVHPARSFIDLALEAVGIDPLDHGLQVLDAQALPDPLVLHLPTLIGHVVHEVALADVVAGLSRIVSDQAPVTVLRELGTAAAEALTVPLGEVDPAWAGLRTTLYVPPQETGLAGVVNTMRRLRQACPWDREQTHRSLAKNLVEETYELLEALAGLPAAAPGGTPDFGAYADVEEELGDVLLQVLFHTAMAEEAGAFTIDDVAEVLRRKLVRRHPHVFGDRQADTPDEVLANWEQIKRSEKEHVGEAVPPGLPALARAAKVQKRAAGVGFDWAEARPVIEKLREEADELAAVLDDPDAAERELGDLLFTLVNLARHLKLDSELALRASVDRFAARFRHMELHGGDLRGRTPEELDALWEEAKRALTEG